MPSATVDSVNVLRVVTSVGNCGFSSRPKRERAGPAAAHPASARPPATQSQRALTARRFFGVETGPRLRVTNMDGRAFVKRSRASWDVIGIDAYTANAYGSTLPAHMATREFFEEVARRLNPGGFMVMNVAAPPHTPIARALQRTLLEVFPHPMVFAGATGNTILVAGRDQRWWKREEVVARAAARIANGEIKLKALEERAGRMVTSSLPLGDARVLTDDYAPVDRLMRESRRWGEKSSG